MTRLNPALFGLSVTPAPPSDLSKLKTEEGKGGSASSFARLPIPANEEVADALLSHLNDEQRRATIHEDGPLLILAGAGSGKTRVMTHRIAYLVKVLGVYPSQILAVTFTNKAAQEMYQRAMGLLEDYRYAHLVTISTFHSLCARILRQNAELVGLQKSYIIYDPADQRAAALRTIEHMGWEGDRKYAKKLLSYVDSQKNLGHTPHDAFESAHNQTDENHAYFYDEYQKLLLENNAVDFGDLIIKTLQLFREHPEVADFYSNRWRYLMVDEYQDTNPAQNELLLHLTRKHNNLAVVGDDDQSIYGWRGASVENILQFEERFEGTTVVRLEQNYRSTQRILNAANDIVRHVEPRHPKTLWTDNPEGAKITFHLGNNEVDEAEWVAAEIDRLHEKGTLLGNIAIFYRTNAQSRLFEEQLLSLSLQYQVVGGVSFYDRKEIKDLISYLRVALNEDSDIDFLRVVNVPPRRVGRKTIEKLDVAGALPGVNSLFDVLRLVCGDSSAAPFNGDEMAFHPSYDAPEIDDIRSVGGSSKAGLHAFYDAIISIRQGLEDGLSPGTLLSDLIENIGYFEYLERTDPENAEDRINNIGELLNAVAEYEELYRTVLQELDELGDNEGEHIELTSTELLRSFLERSSLLQSVDSTVETGRVTLMTIHGSKGLEFDSVFVTGLEEGVFPGAKATSEREIAEERRLAYVALTRARKELYLSAARTRRIYNERESYQVSPFVYDIADDLIELSGESLPLPKQRKTLRPADLGYIPIGDDGLPCENDFGRRHFAKKSTRRRDTDYECDEPPSYVDDEYSQIPTSYEEEEWIPPERRAPTKKKGDLSNRLEPGVTVSHAQFGIGKILHVAGRSDTSIITVYFPTSGEKKVVRKFLKILG